MLIIYPLIDNIEAYRAPLPAIVIYALSRLNNYSWELRAVLAHNC